MASATGNFSSSVVSPSLEEARRQLRGAIEEQERIEALLMAKIEQIIAQATASASSSQNRLSAEIEALEEEERRATCAFESATQAYTRARQAAQEQRRLILLAPATASSTSRFASSTSRFASSSSSFGLGLLLLLLTRCEQKLPVAREWTPFGVQNDGSLPQHSPRPFCVG